MVNVNNSFVGSPAPDGGVASHAPQGTTLPASAIATPDVAFKDVGAIGEKGLQWKFDRKSKDIKIMGGETFRTVQEEFASGCTLTLMEDANHEVEKIVFGADNVTVSAPDANGVKTTIYLTSNQLPIESWLMKVIDGEKTKVYAIERAQVASVKEFTDVHNDTTGYEIELSFYKSSHPSGCTVQILKNDAALAV